MEGTRPSVSVLAVKRNSRKSRRSANVYKQLFFNECWKDIATGHFLSECNEQ